MPVNFKAIGKRLKEIRKREGLSQASLAEKADLSAQYVSQIETAKKRASLESLVKMANAMHVSVDDLLYGNMPENPKEYQTDISDLMNDCSCFETSSNMPFYKTGINFLIHKRPASLITIPSGHREFQTNFNKNFLQYRSLSARIIML